MKFRSWMEMHIVRPKKSKSKKEKSKKGSDLSMSIMNRSPLDSAGNSPTSPQLPKRQSILLPEMLENSDSEFTSPMGYFLQAHHAQLLQDHGNHNNYFYSPFRQPSRGSCACACFSSGLPQYVCRCYPMFDEQCNLVDEFRKLHTIRTSLIPVDQFQDTVPSNVNSPRQRNKIRTNPWLTPKTAKDNEKPFPIGSSGSDCGSISDENFKAESNQPSIRNSNMSVTTESSDNLSNSNLSLVSPMSSSKRALSCADSVSSLDEKEKFSATSMAKHDRLKAIFASGNDSESDECETLNELGRFEENYEYERETDILDDDTDDELYDHSRMFFRKDSPDGDHTPIYADFSTRIGKEKIKYVDMEDAADEIIPSANLLGINIIEDEDTTDDNATADADTGPPSDTNTFSTWSSQVTSPGSEINGKGDPLDINNCCLASNSTEGAARTLGEIRESLEEKVRRLRLERLFVEEKIREAREEEEMRREEKIKFQKQLILHRRQILLRTLRNLRDKLEDQSARLQDAYSATLDMQLQLRQQLQSSKNTREVVAFITTTNGLVSKLAKEAPF